MKLRKQLLWHYQRSLLLLLLVCAVGTQFFISTYAFANEDDDEAPLDRRYAMTADWVLTLTVSKLDRMLKYPGSAIHPITQIRISYFLRDPNTRRWPAKSELYEDLWFHNGTAIGCKRYKQLPFRYGSYGVIAVQDGKECITQTKALDDAILRLVLDVSHTSSVVSSTVLPLEICNNAASDFSTFNFYRATMITSGRVILLHVQSTPRGYDRYFSYLVK